MDKKLNEIHENLIPTKLTNMPYNIKWYNTMLNKNTYGAKKGEANQKQQLSDYTCD